MPNKILIALLLLTAAGAGCNRGGGSSGSPASSGAAARVNGKEIARSEVESYFNLRTADMTVKPTGDAARFLQLEILRQLIETEIMSQKAAELDLEPTEVEIEAQLMSLRGNASEEDFQKTLADRGITEENLRREISQNLMLEKVYENQVGSKVQVTDAEIGEFYEENKEAFNVSEPMYRIGVMAVTSDASASVNNRLNDKALNEEQAVRKIQMLEARIRAGEDFQALARDYSEDPQTAQMGGDLGYQSTALLDRFGAGFRDTVVKMQVGDMTPVIRAENSYWLFKLLGRREPGQYDLSDTEVKQGIQAELQGRKQQLLTAAFSEKLHNDVRVENFLAREILASFEPSK